jgi:hypothetical protein
MNDYLASAQCNARLVIQAQHDNKKPSKPLTLKDIFQYAALLSMGADNKQDEWICAESASVNHHSRCFGHTILPAAMLR